MLYAVLDQKKKETAGNCAFYLRSDSLSEQWYGQSAPDGRLTALKERILSDEAVPSARYNSLEEFGQQVMRDMLSWLDREFPMREKAGQVRRNWYNRELLRNYIEISAHHGFLDRYFQESDRSLLIYGDGGRGKTTLLTAWEPARGRKLLINCGSDDIYLYWPSVAREIINALNDISIDCGMPDIKAGASIMFQLMQAVHDEKQSDSEERMSTDFYFVTDEEREDFRVAFLQWLAQLPLREPVYIIINDLNLLEDDSSHLLSWLPSAACGNVRFVCSTNNDEMVRNAQTIGWNCRELPLFPREFVEEFLKNYLNIYGKSLSAAQMDALSQAAVSTYPGLLRFVADFLIDFGRFQNLDDLIGELTKRENAREIYRYVFDYLTAELTDRECRAARTVLGLLRCARMSLKEQECFTLAGELTGVTAMEWARIRGIFEQLELVKGDYWNMRKEEIQKFTDALLTPGELAGIQELLGDDMVRRLQADDTGRGSLRLIRERTAYAKAALFHYRSCENWKKLCSVLTDHRVLYYLSKLDWQEIRVSWVAVFLHSDTDIPAILLELLERYRGAMGDDRQIAIYVAGLFVDLEQRTYLDRVKEITGESYISGTLNPDFSKISPGFADQYNRMQELKSRGQFRQLYSQADRALSSGESFLPIERCQLLFFKADSESHLQLFDQFLETANVYYDAAIHAGSVYDMRRALSQRGDALYRLGQYRQAAQCQRQVSLLALREGDLRSHLAARNILAMCLYRDREYAASIAEFDALLCLWKRLGDEGEAANILMNKCNALSISGDDRSALETASRNLPQLAGGSVMLQSIHASLLGNMGTYAMNLKEYQTAEGYLLQSAAEAEQLGLDSTMLRSRFVLIELYRRTDQAMKAVELSKKQMELLWERREYGRLVETLSDAVKLLYSNKYAPMARDLQKSWEEKFSRIQGGSQFFAQQMNTSVTDRKYVEGMKEQLAMAKSEADPGKIAQAYRDLADAVGSDDRKQGLEYILEAAAYFRACGREDRSGKCLEDALCLLFEDGKPRYPALQPKIFAQIKDPTVRKIGELWERIGSGGPGKKPAAPEKKRSWLDNFRSSRVPQQTAAVPELLEELIACGNTHSDLVLRCLMDVIQQIITQCTAQQMIRMAQSLPPKRAEVLVAQLDSAMLKNFQEDINELTKDYASPQAEEKLAYYEKCFQVLDTLQSWNIAAVAGNLALIFRRREDKEKTLRYHERSMALYKKSGSIRDYLIELMNLATACDKFGQPDRAAELLRQGLTEASEAGEERMKAAIAGNLASFLSREADPADRDEIRSCFAIEEQYFRSSGSQRDLAISLLNQIRYLRKSGDTVLWKDKLKEAGHLVRANRFWEFESTLAKLEWAAQQEAGPAAEMNEAMAKEKIRQLLTAGGFALDSISREENTYHAVCLPEKKADTEAELLHLFLDPASPNKITAIFLCQPRMVQMNAADGVKQYVTWWNDQGSYRLRLHEKDMVLQADCVIRAADWDGLAERFCSYVKLWQADKTSMTMMCIGLSDLSLYQRLKLKILNEGQ